MLLMLLNIVKMTMVESLLEANSHHPISVMSSPMEDLNVDMASVEPELPSQFTSPVAVLDCQAIALISSPREFGESCVCGVE